jgi:Bifunctional DNA primase/polymerase, N-terminal
VTAPAALSDCESVGKHPIPRLVPRGLHDADSRLDTVAAWWRSVPYANIGIRTGIESGVVVLDVDGQAGRRALRALVNAHAQFDARWARSGGGGWHAYFAHPGATMPSSAGRVDDGLDVRGEGGDVVAPPSRHGTCRIYRWVVPPHGSANAGGLPPIPRWLLHLAAAPAAPAGSRPAHVWLRTGRSAAYATAAVEREAHEIAHAPVGQRNHRLNRAAFRLGQLVGAGMVEESIAAAALVKAGLAAGPGERKIRSTVRRGLQAGIRQPRRIGLHPPT